MFLFENTIISMIRKSILKTQKTVEEGVKRLLMSPIAAKRIITRGIHEYFCEIPNAINPAMRNGRT